jgi:Uma2 family endonuclease
MATAVEPKMAKSSGPPQGEQRVLLRGVGWEGYESLLRMVGDGHVRVTYDRGDAELMSPSRDHEAFKTRIGRLIEALTEILDLPCEGAGSTTWRKHADECGLEPDECYYLANAERVIGRSIDLSIDPPPDLAVEIEISRSALGRMGIYARLGVPEVWRFDGETLRIERLTDAGAYEEVPGSPSLPFLTAVEVTHWLRLGQSMGQTPWIQQFRDWVRNELAPRRGGGAA